MPLVKHLELVKRMRVKEERHNADESDAVPVGPGFFIRVARHDNLSEIVADVTE